MPQLGKKYAAVFLGPSSDGIPVYAEHAPPGGLTATRNEWRYECIGGVNYAFKTVLTYVAGVLVGVGAEVFDHTEGCCACGSGSGSGSSPCDFLLPYSYACVTFSGWTGNAAVFNGTWLFTYSSGTGTLVSQDIACNGDLVFFWIQCVSDGAGGAALHLTQFTRTGSEFNAYANSGTVSPGSPPSVTWTTTGQIAGACTLTAPLPTVTVSVTFSVTPSCSGSGSGSGGCGGGFVAGPAGCCPGTCIPTSLHLTLSSACACANGSVPLNWDGTQWTGSLICSFHTTTWHFVCDSGAFKLKYICDGFVYQTSTASSVACSPFDVSGTFASLLDPSGCCAGQSCLWEVTP